MNVEKASQLVSTTSDRQTFYTRLLASVCRSLLHFQNALRCYPLAANTLLLLGAFRVWLNLLAGISLANALRSMLIGWFFVAFQVVLIDVIYFMLLSKEEGNLTSTSSQEQPQQKNAVVLVFLLAV